MNEIIIRLNDNKKVTSVSVDGEVIMKPSEKGNGLIRGVGKRRSDYWRS